MLALAVIYRTTFAAIVLVSCVAFVHAQGTITTIAGNGQFRFTGNGGRAVDAPLGQTVGVATDPQGNVYAADRNNHVPIVCLQKFLKAFAAWCLSPIRGIGVLT